MDRKLLATELVKLAKSISPDEGLGDFTRHGLAVVAINAVKESYAKVGGSIKQTDLEALKNEFMKALKKVLG